MPAADDIDILDEIEPIDEIEPEQTEPSATVAMVATPTLVEILGADDPIPFLAKWIPNVALRDRALTLANEALAIAVTGPEGIAAADAKLGELREAHKANYTQFEEPAAILNKAHKRVTGLRSEWTTESSDAIKTVSDRIVSEEQRLERIEAEKRRQEQAEADRQAREAAAAEAKAAAEAQAPAEVIEDLFKQAQAAVAPPVATRQPAAPLKSSATVKSYKARLASTTGDREPNPDIADLNAAERNDVLTLLRAIVEGKAPLQALAINWSYLNTRAKADKTTLQIPGIVAYEIGGLRAKGGRRV